MKFIRSLACWLGLLVTAQAAEATVLFFTDRASFESAVTVSQKVDFESSFSDGVSISLGDATFVSTDGSGLFRTVADSFENPTTTLAAQNSGGVRIDLAPGYFAIGLDVGELLGVATGQFMLTGSGGTLDSRTTAVGFLGDSPSFLGWISTDEIGSLEFFITSRPAFEAIDNVTLGVANSTANVPLPGGFALLALGLGLIAVTRRSTAES